MAELKVASVNCRTYIEKVTSIGISDSISLSQFDIILFNLQNIPSNISENQILYWQQQLKTSYDNGRTIIILLDTNYSLQVRNSYGQNYNYYSFLPFELHWEQETMGTDINHCASNNKLILDFINQIKIICDGDFLYTTTCKNDSSDWNCILKNGNNEAIGFINQNGQKCCLLLPQIKFDNVFITSFISAEEEKKKLQKRFLGVLIQLYKSLHVGSAYESEPDWLSNQPIYQTSKELENRIQITNNKEEIVRINNENKTLEDEAFTIGQLRYLLYANDKPLERAVNYALQILGAESCEYDNKEERLQIDNLIEYDEIVLLGEDKGHDGYANNDDINQLIGNRNQYYKLECDDNSSVPKGVLFVCSERKKELDKRKRNDVCSGKVLKLSISDKIPIVYTPDLFFIAKYVMDNNDIEFAKDCMKAIIDTESGIVQFPSIPV